MSDNQTIKLGSTVAMHFIIRLEDKSVAETTHEGDPSVFTMTEESLNDPVESKLIGLSVGDKTTIELTPEEGFGHPEQGNIHTMAKSKFPEELEPQEGDLYAFNAPDGQEVPGRIVKVDDGDVTVDFNHPLSGQTIWFEAEIVEVSNEA